MSPNSQSVAKMYEQLSEREQAIIAELIYRLLPDDVATPEDIAAHAAAMEDYRLGECVRHEDIDWD